MNSCPRVIIAGTHSGTGKTTLTMGLLLALKKQGLSVQAYKVGPDYIDTGFHSRISGRPCRNLDSYLLSEEAVGELFERQSGEVMFSVIEGVMGLFDGADAFSSPGSTAHIASILNIPVILVIDAGKMARSAAAVALGYKMFDERLPLAGFIVNRIGSQSHYRIVKQAIEEKTHLPVLGFLPKDGDLMIPERHLGLTPVQETNISLIYEKLTVLVEQGIDLEAIQRIGKQAGPLPSFRKTLFTPRAQQSSVKLAVAFDECFHFYYQDNLDILEHLGAGLHMFSPLRDTAIPDDADGVYIGGGCPELFARTLAQNASLREDIRAGSEAGMPIYAECGGLIYLMKELESTGGERYPMAGIFPGRVKMGKGLQSFGYHAVETLQTNILSKVDQTTRGHVFHWSHVEDMPTEIPTALRLRKNGKFFSDGYINNNTLAGYVHIHFGTNLSWAKRFIQHCFNYHRRISSAQT